MVEFERMIGYFLSFAAGAIGGACSYFVKIKGIEDKLETKCDREQVEKIIEKRLIFLIEDQKKDMESIKSILRSVAEQVGAKTPLK